MPIGLVPPLSAPFFFCPPQPPDSGNLSSQGIKAEPVPEPHSPRAESEPQAVVGCGAVAQKAAQLTEVELREESDSAQGLIQTEKGSQKLLCPQMHTHAPIHC